MRALQRFLVGVCLFASSGLTTQGSTSVRAETDFPTKPIRFIVPFPAGGVTDIVARALGQSLSQDWGQPFIIENRPGANTFIGAEQVARAAPDGYTILLAADITMSINPLIFKKLPYDPINDFAPISAAVETSQILVVTPSVPVNTVGELVAYAKKHPGELNYASFGPGTQPHLAMEALKANAGIDVVHVPYKGVAPAVTDLLSGQVQLLFASVATPRPFIISGKLRALGVAGPKRLPILPDVPTFEESGFPKFESRGWFGVVAPANTPKDVVAKLSQGIARAVNNDEFRQKYLIPSGLEAVGNTPEEFAAYLQRDRENWAVQVNRVRNQLE